MEKMPRSKKAPNAAPRPNRLRTNVPNKESLCAQMRKFGLSLEDLTNASGIRYHALYKIVISGDTVYLTEGQMERLTKVFHCTASELTSPPPQLPRASNAQLSLA